MEQSGRSRKKGYERPITLLIAVVLEAFAGVRYLLDAIAFPSFDIIWVVLLALMIISFLVAFGLWRIARWAWVVSLALSLFGVISTVSLLAIGGATEYLLFRSIPSIVIDLFVVVMLLSKTVRGMFWETNRGFSGPADITPKP